MMFKSRSWQILMIAVLIPSQETIVAWAHDIALFVSIIPI